MATPIGTLVVEMTANTAKFRADLDKANDSAKGFGTKASAAVAGTQRAFQQVASAGRTMAQSIASNVSPAVAEATQAIGVMATSLTRLPVAAGIAVTGLVALTIVLQRIVANLNAAQEAQAKLAIALERGDAGALRQQLQGLRKELEDLNQAERGAQDLFKNLFSGDVLGTLKSFFSLLKYNTSRGLGAITKEAEAAGKGLAKLITPEVEAAAAAFQVQLQQIRGAVAQFNATLAESVNDEDAFTRAIERSILALKTQAGGAAEGARLKMLEEIKKANSDVKLSAAGIRAEEERITAEYEQQLLLIGERLDLDVAQQRERQRTGVLGIQDRLSAPIGANWQEEQFGPTILAEQLPHVREVVQGYTTDLDNLRAMQMLVSEASGNLAARQSLIAQEMQRLIAAGYQPQDAALTKLAREYNDLQREMNLIADTAVVDALAQQTAELSMTTREVARYRAQLQLSGDASDYLREKVGEMAAQLDDQQQIIAAAEQITQAFGAGLVDLMIDMENFDPREFLKGIARMITAMAIATLVAQGLKAALGFFAPTAPAADFSGVGADVLRGVPTTASGGVVTSPQVRMVGEAGPEAIIPLSQLGGGEVNVSVEIINQTGTPVSQQTEQTTGPDGQRMLRVFLRKEVAGAIGDGSLDPVMSSAFGLKRKGVSR